MLPHTFSSPFFQLVLFRFLPLSRNPLPFLVRIRFIFLDFFFTSCFCGASCFCSLICFFASHWVIGVLFVILCCTVRDCFRCSFKSFLLGSRSEEHTSELQSRFDLV